MNLSGDLEFSLEALVNIPSLSKVRQGLLGCGRLTSECPTYICPLGIEWHRVKKYSSRHRSIYSLLLLAIHFYTHTYTPLSWLLRVVQVNMNLAYSEDWFPIQKTQSLPTMQAAKSHAQSLLSKDGTFIELKCTLFLSYYQGSKDSCSSIRFTENFLSIPGNAL